MRDSRLYSHLTSVTKAITHPEDAYFFTDLLHNHFTDDALLFLLEKNLSLLFLPTEILAEHIRRGNPSLPNSFFNMDDIHCQRLLAARFSEINDKLCLCCVRDDLLCQACTLKLEDAYTDPDLPRVDVQGVIPLVGLLVRNKVRVDNVGVILHELGKKLNTYDAEEGNVESFQPLRSYEQHTYDVHRDDHSPAAFSYSNGTMEQHELQKSGELAINSFIGRFDPRQTTPQELLAALNSVTSTTSSSTSSTCASTCAAVSAAAALSSTLTSTNTLTSSSSSSGGDSSSSSRSGGGGGGAVGVVGGGYSASCPQDAEAECNPVRPVGRGHVAVPGNSQTFLLNNDDGGGGGGGRFGVGNHQPPSITTTVPDPAVISVTSMGTHQFPHFPQEMHAMVPFMLHNGHPMLTAGQLPTVLPPPPPMTTYVSPYPITRAIAGSDDGHPPIFIAPPVAKPVSPGHFPPNSPCRMMWDGEEKEVCKDYLHGACSSKRSNCRFFHPPGDPDHWKQFMLNQDQHPTTVIDIARASVITAYPQPTPMAAIVPSPTTPVILPGGSTDLTSARSMSMSGSSVCSSIGSSNLSGSASLTRAPTYDDESDDDIVDSSLSPGINSENHITVGVGGASTAQRSTNRKPTGSWAAGTSENSGGGNRRSVAGSSSDITLQNSAHVNTETESTTTPPTTPPATPAPTTTNLPSPTPHHHPPDNNTAIIPITSSPPNRHIYTETQLRSLSLQPFSLVRWNNLHPEIRRGGPGHHDDTTPVQYALPPPSASYVFDMVFHHSSEALSKQLNHYPYNDDLIFIIETVLSDDLLPPFAALCDKILGQVGNWEREGLCTPGSSIAYLPLLEMFQRDDTYIVQDQSVCKSLYNNMTQAMCTPPFHPGWTRCALSSVLWMLNRNVPITYDTLLSCLKNASACAFKAEVDVLLLLLHEGHDCSLEWLYTTVLESTFENQQHEATRKWIHNLLNAVWNRKTLHIHLWEFCNSILDIIRNGAVPHVLMEFSQQFLRNNRTHLPRELTELLRSVGWDSRDTMWTTTPDFDVLDEALGAYMESLILTCTSDIGVKSPQVIRWTLPLVSAIYRWEKSDSPSSDSNTRIDIYAHAIATFQTTANAEDDADNL